MTQLITVYIYKKLKSFNSRKVCVTTHPVCQVPNKAPVGVDLQFLGRATSVNRATRRSPGPSFCWMTSTYTAYIPHPKHTLKYTKVKVLHTQDKHTQLSSFALLHCYPMYKLKVLLMLTHQSTLTHTHCWLATCALLNWYEDETAFSSKTQLWKHNATWCQTVIRAQNQQGCLSASRLHGHLPFSRVGRGSVYNRNNDEDRGRAELCVITSGVQYWCFLGNTVSFREGELVSTSIFCSTRTDTGLRAFGRPDFHPMVQGFNQICCIV